MDILTAFFVFLLVWWTLLFTVLPLGIERAGEEGQGHDAGAPKNANLKKKLILNTVISFVFVAIIWVLVDIGVIRWSEWFDGAYK